MVEFALIAPILLLILFGVVDFARAWSAHQAIADAAREGARMLVVHDEDVNGNTVQAAISNRLALARLNPDRMDVEFELNGSPWDGITSHSTGDAVTVIIEYAYDFWILAPFMNWATGDRQVNLVSTITMRSE